MNVNVLHVSGEITFLKENVSNYVIEHPSVKILLLPSELIMLSFISSSYFKDAFRSFIQVFVASFHPAASITFNVERCFDQLRTRLSK